MVSNDKNTDNPQKGHIINYRDLEIGVDNAIKKASPELFSELFRNRTQKECKYIQKVAEDRLSKFEITINAIIFIAAVAVSFVFPYLITKEGIIEFLVGVFIFILAIYLACCYWKPKYEACRRIILDAEQKLPEGSVEPKPQQEINNITSNTQKNPISIEYIKAKLDLLKIVIAPLITAISLIALYTIQTSGYNYNNVWISIILIGIFVIFLARKYYRPLMNELK